MRPAVWREIVHYLQKVYDIGERRACKATGFHHSSQRYKSRGDPQTELRIRLRDLAASRVRCGYRRLHVLQPREGYRLNHKRTYRLYREEGLSLRTKTPKRKQAWRHHSGRPEIVAAHHCGAMDFMSDALFDGRPFRLLTVVDCHTRGSLAIVPRTNFRASQVVEVLQQLTRERGKPETIRCDNGPEFADKILDQWAYHNSVEINFSNPESPRTMHFARLATVTSGLSV